MTITGPSGAQIRYTTDGSTPTSSSQLYSGAFSLSASSTVKAIAIKDGVVSTVANKSFTKSDNSGGNSGSDSSTTTVEAPVISRASGTFSFTGIQITGPEGASIYYTTDGSTPTINDHLYSEPFDFSGNGTVKAIAVKNGHYSAVAEFYVQQDDED